MLSRYIVIENTKIVRYAIFIGIFTLYPLGGSKLQHKFFTG